MKNPYAKALGGLAAACLVGAVLLVLFGLSTSSQGSRITPETVEAMQQLAAGARWLAYRVAAVGIAALIGWLVVRAVSVEHEQALAAAIRRIPPALPPASPAGPASSSEWEQPAQLPAE
jgi:hypothetical protein